VLVTELGLGFGARDPNVAAHVVAHDAARHDLVTAQEAHGVGVNRVRGGRLGQPRDVGERLEDLLVGQVFAAQDVALAGDALLHGQDMTEGHVFDVDHVQTAGHDREGQ
jgi:hypothetical protein